MVVSLIAVCGLIIGGLYWYRARINWTPAQLATYLPTKDAVLVYVDVEQLRQAGLLDILAGSRSVEDVEYKKFIEESGFDYRTDLDRLVVAFQNDQRFGIARGRFNWKKINQYTVASGGACHNSVCDYKPDQLLQRTVSYYPVRSEVMGLYSGSTDWGVYAIGQGRTEKAQWPDAPVWISVPSSIWANAKDLPAGTKTFVSVFAEAKQVVFAANVATTGSGIDPKHFKLYADIVCADADGATKLEARLREATDLLKKMMAREEKTPNPKDLAYLLYGGEFKLDGATLHATWPLERAFLQDLADGGIK